MEVRRRHLRLPQYDYSSAGAYFVTCCVHGRRCILGDIVDDRMQLNANGRIVAECWMAISKHFTGVTIDAFVVMPNHLHGIVVIEAEQKARHASPLRDGGTTLGAIVGSFKSAVSRQLPEVKPLWQRGYYEHVIRSEHSLRQIREYIVNNPKQWALDRENPANYGR